MSLKIFSPKKMDEILAILSRIIAIWEKIIILLFKLAPTKLVAIFSFGFWALPAGMTFFAYLVKALNPSPNLLNKLQGPKKPQPKV
jgi:hypothetical protein